MRKLYWIFLCLSIYATAQNSELTNQSTLYSLIKKGDSLSKAKNRSEALSFYQMALAISLDEQKKDTVSILYKKIGILFYLKKDYATAEINYQKGFAIDSLSKNAADIQYNLFLIKRKLNQQDSILSYLKNSLDLYESNSLGYSSYNTFLTAGIVYKNRQLYDQSIQYLIKAYAGFETLGNDKKLASVCTTIGNVHNRLKNYNQALNYHYKALVFEKRLNNKKGIARSYINIGNVQDNLQKTDSAIANYQKSLNYIAPKTSLYAKTLGNLGFTYKDNSEFNNAIQSFKNAVKINVFLKDTTALLYNYNGLAATYLKSGQLNQVKPYLMKIERIIQGSSDRLILLDYYQNKVAHLQQVRQYKVALEFQQKYSDLYKEIYNEQQTEIVQNIQEKFENEKKENEILKLKLANKNSQLLIAEKDRAISRKNLILIILSFVIVLALIIFYSLSQRQKVTVQQSKIEKLEAIYEGQETIKKRIARDLHDIITTNFDGLRLKILALKKSKEINQLIDETTNEIKSINNQIRTVSHRLSPLEMHMTKQVFTKVIKARLTEFQLYGKVFVELENQLPEVLNTLTLSAQNNVYGILLEILNNVEKHSHATKLVVRSLQEKGRLHFTFTDNGIGISKDSQDGIGLLNIKQRSELLNGTCAVKSLGSGTQVSITFPIKPSK